MGFNDHFLLITPSFRCCFTIHVSSPNPIWATPKILMFPVVAIRFSSRLISFRACPIRNALLGGVHKNIDRKQDKKVVLSGVPRKL